MKVHVIYAHPVDESFSAAIHRTVVETLIRSGHEVRDLDLYALRVRSGSCRLGN